MTETSINYAKALYELSVPEEAVLETEQIKEKGKKYVFFKRKRTCN